MCNERIEEDECKMNMTDHQEPNMHSLHANVGSNMQPEPNNGRPILIQCGCWGNCAHPLRLPDPSSALDKNRAPMGPEILSSTGAGVWRKALMACEKLGPLQNRKTAPEAK